MEKGFIVIADWMVEKLNLTGNRLIIYALVHNNCMEYGCYNRPLSYITDNLKINKTTVTRILKELVEKGLIKKQDNIVDNINYAKYTVTNNGRIS